MQRTRFAALLFVAIVLISACPQPGLTADKGKKSVTISASCTAADVTISRTQSKAEHVRWTTPNGSHFRVTFSGESPCHKSNDPNGNKAITTYDVPGGHESDQCFALPTTETKHYKYSIDNLSSGIPVQCADPAVIVEN